MKTALRLPLAFALAAASALPAMASITVYTPSNGATVPTQFTLSAAASNCSSQAIASMGFSLDSSSNTTIVKAATIDATVTSATGAHTLHVKAWGNSGAVCVTDVALNVVNSTSTTTTTTSSTPTTTTTSTTSAVQGITVTTPTPNATVQSPFSLSAKASTCSSQTVASMGYSLDNSSNTAIVKSNSVQATVTATAGAHTLHVKSWGNSGASCVDNIAINVTTTSTTTTTPVPAGGVTITSPTNGATVTSPIPVAANAATCSGQTVTSIGYGLDNATKTLFTGTSLSTQVPATAGSHTMNVTAWGSGGAACSASVTVNVADPTTTLVPSTAINVSSIQTLTNWQAANDPATGSGSSSGTMGLIASPSLSGNALQFNTTFTNSAGELYHVTFGDDPNATNFFYDAWVYFSGSAANVANLELDMNQVMSNGQTVIYGFQCDGYSGTWDYTENAGTPTSPSDHWIHSSAACNVRNWTVNAWHHIQVSYSRDSSGNVTYHSVWLDGNESQINATVPSSFALGWAQVLLTNFQIDGLGSGSNTVYLDKLTISRW